MDKIKDYFDRYPNSEEVFENGGRLFHNSGAADSFAQTETKRYSRTEAEKAVQSETDSTTKVPSENVETPSETAGASDPSETSTSKTKSE